MQLVGTNGNRVASPIRFMPTWNRVLMRKLDPEEATAAGLFLPGQYAGKAAEGEVIAVGPGKQNDQGEWILSPFKVGDILLFSDQSALGLDPSAPEQVMVEAGAILAVKVKA